MDGRFSYVAEKVSMHYLSCGIRTVDQINPPHCIATRAQPLNS